MKYTFFAHASDLSGASRSLYDLVTALIQEEKALCQIILPGEGPLVNWFRAIDCEVVLADPEAVRIWQWVSAWNAADFYRAYDALVSNTFLDVKAFSPDYIISQTIVSPWGALCAEVLDLPHVLSAREYGVVDHALTFHFGFEPTIAAFYQNSARILSISQDVSSVLFGADFEHKCGVVYSGIELERQNKTVTSPLKIASLFPEKTGPIIGLIGTIQPGKGQLDLVQAVLHELRNGKALRCFMVGMVADHKYHDQLLHEIKTSGFADRFAIVGFVDDIYSLMRQVDIIVSCSKREALGRTLIEAALLEKPIIYAKSGGPSEVFEDGLHGLSYTPGQANELANAIRDTLFNAEKTQQRVSNARSYCQAFFSRKSYAQRVIALLQSQPSQNVSRNSISSLISGGLKFSPGQLTFSPKLYPHGVSGYSEEAVVYLPESTLGKFIFDYRFTETYPDQLRFDPMENVLSRLNNFCVIAYDQKEKPIAESRVTIKHNGKVDGSSIMFFNFDPQLELIFDKPVSRVVLQGEIRKVSFTLNQMVSERDKKILDLDFRLTEILNSKSWRLTKPLRDTRRLFGNFNFAFPQLKVSGIMRKAWHALPVSFQAKCQLRSRIFKILPALFRNTSAYKNWQSFQHSIVEHSRGGYEATIERTETEYVPLLKAEPPIDTPVKLICFYLPQFHPIPENDAWWGEGFTEWSNVHQARPQFLGHYQPHVPVDLGYYSLLDPGIQRHQIELAKLYGIGGFCFYFYWFGGKRLLEAPLENYLSDRSLDLPFCLCWANENWSRRWDGLDSEILIAQEHSPDDDYAFIKHVAQYMRDPRYIRIEGRPLLLVYRPSLLPSALETASRWRQWCLANDIGEIYLAYTQSFEKTDPKEYGFDAAVEFPPNNSAPPDITDDITPYGDGFEGKVYDWRVFIERSAQYAASGYKLFRSVCPSWDNTARRKKTGTIFYNSSPALYERWLKNAIYDTVAHQVNPEERLIFINAWNEWAEGAHLEPDAKYGYAWLQATRNAIAGESFTPDNVRRIILVAHDAYPHGAQMLVAHMAKVLNQSLGFKVDLVCLGDGPLKSEYAKWATLHDLSGNDPHGEKAISLARALYAQGHRHALVNTTVSGYFLKTLSDSRIKCVALIHELRGILEAYQLHGQAESIAAYASKIVFAAQEVANSFNEFSKISADKVVVRPQGVYKRCDKSRNINAVRAQLRQMLKLSDDAVIVLGAGYADHRKGIDLFVKAGLLMAARVPQARWVWIGHWERTMQNEVDKLLAAHPDRRNVFIFPGLQADTDVFYRGADIFALTSREDPFPSVMLEALDAEIPVVGFEGAGGFNTLLKEGCGAVVAKEDAQAFANTVADLLERTEARLESGKRGLALINQRFSFRHYLYDLLDYLGIGLARVSVVVPNYNYAHFLPERLESIIGQGYPIYEIIFLDDCSSDESLQVAERLLSQSGIDYQIIVNKKNSGSVFRQWRKGVELARGTHLWIAEADDSCEAGLISELVKGFRTPGVVLSYCESKQMDENNTLLAENYRYYVDDVDTKHWLSAYVMDGKHEIAEYLSVKNTIPNISGVLFSKDALQSVLEKHFDEITAYRVAGDWMVYVLVLAEGKVSFSPASMNKHRRHSGGVTISGINRSQLEEIQKMQQYIAAHYPVKENVIANASRYIDALCREHKIDLCCEVSDQHFSS
jgi:glycosyltransferase involved in cell wall biosynthesis